VTGVPHSAQNLAPGARTVPQLRHDELSAFPHSLQNLALGWTAAPHLGQFIRIESLARSPAATAYRLDALGASGSTEAPGSLSDSCSADGHDIQ
jgi:hypothetical protein